MSEEYKEMYAKDYVKDPETKLAFKDGLTALQSDSCDFQIEHCPHFPVTLVLFYDVDIYPKSIMTSLAIKILDVFVFKFESQLSLGHYQNFSNNVSPPSPNNNLKLQAQVMTVGEDGQIIFNSNPGTTFESVLPLVYEDTLYEFVKYLHIKLNSINL